MNLLKSFVLLVLCFGQFRHKRSILVTACNTFNDYCDIFNEEADDINNKRGTQFVPLLKTSTVNNHNYSAIIELDDNRSKRSSYITVQNEEKTSTQVTTILDKLLFRSGYDRQFRPQINGPPVKVTSQER